MSLAELREAAGLLSRMPALWIPGLVAGILGSVLWLVLIFSGAFFAGRLVLIFALALLFFITGSYVMIRDNDGDIRTLVTMGRRYYFRAFLPLAFIGFMTILVFVLVVLTLTLIGTPPDSALMVFLCFGVTIPSLLLTLFADTAAIFEDKKVFDSVQRSIDLVSRNMAKAISFVIIAAIVCCAILFFLMVAWEAILLDKLAPVMEYTEEQLKAFTPDQLMALIGTDGVWVTAIILFIAGLVIVPVLTSYKACFFRKLSSATIPIQQVTGEYDSKGRWYKY